MSPAIFALKNSQAAHNERLRYDTDVACPFFMPTERLDSTPWIVPPRVPLNDTFRGVCCAAAEAFEPPESSQRELCNCGYARGRCERFPPHSAADAVRFSICAERAGTVQLVYILERDHSPAEHGTLEYSVAEARVVSGEISALLNAQVRAFLWKYLDSAAIRSRH